MPDQTNADKAIAALRAQNPTTDIEFAKEHARAVLRTYGFDETNSAVVERGGHVTCLLQLDPVLGSVALKFGGGQ